MRVALNGTCFNDRPSGANQRFKGIYGELIRQSQDTEFLIYEPADCRVSSWFEGAPNVVARPTSIPSESRFRKHFSSVRYLNRLLQQQQIDIFERFNIPLVRVRSGRNLMTVHDIRDIKGSESWVSSRVKKAYLGLSVKQADVIITVSNAMRDEILDHYPDAEIAVIYNGINAPEFSSVSEPQRQAFKQRHDLPAEYALAVGHFEERKNYLRLIEAFALLKKQGDDVPLVIIGNDNGYRETVARSVRSKGFTGRVFLLSDLDDDELKCAYSLCRLFVFPSSYEGFGIPLLEAMAFSKPLVTSDLPVFREITEDQTAYFDPRNIESMAEAISMGISSSAYQSKVADYGARRVQAFSFTRLASQLRELHDKVRRGA